MIFVAFTASQQKSNRSWSSTGAGSEAGVKLFGIGVDSELKISDSDYFCPMDRMHQR